MYTCCANPPCLHSPQLHLHPPALRKKKLNIKLNCFKWRISILIGEAGEIRIEEMREMTVERRRKGAMLGKIMEIEKRKRERK